MQFVAVYTDAPHFFHLPGKLRRSPCLIRPDFHHGKAEGLSDRHRIVLHEYFTFVHKAYARASLRLIEICGGHKNRDLFPQEIVENPPEVPP